MRPRRTYLCEAFLIWTAVIALSLFAQRCGVLG